MSDFDKDRVKRGTLTFIDDTGETIHVYTSKSLIEIEEI